MYNNKQPICKTKEQINLASWSYLVDTLTPEQFKEYLMIALGGKDYELKRGKSKREQTK